MSGSPTLGPNLLKALIDAGVTDAASARRLHRVLGRLLRNEANLRALEREARDAEGRPERRWGQGAKVPPKHRREKDPS
jgi:hypothetical protein